MMFLNRFTVVLFCAFGISGAVNIAITDTIDGHTISLSSEDDLETVLNQLRRFERISIHESPLDNPEEHVTEPSDMSDEENIDSWSIVWYVASFGGLITFFLVVSCSEWCCRKHVREQQSRRTQPASPPSPTPSFDVPPPAYDLFAPPSYDSLSYARSSGEKSEFEVYVVPVHSLGGLTNTTSELPPPSYSIANETTTTTTTTTATVTATATSTATTTATPQRNSVSVS